MGDYILNENKTFQAFLRTEDVIEKNRFPLISRFAEDEKEFFVRKIKKIGSGNKVIEMGCGAGRLLRILEHEGFSVIGFDNDKISIDYCKKRRLDVFYGDATKKLPQELKSVFGVAVVDFNTLFNFPEAIRRRWVENAAYLLKKGGLLLLTVFHLQ